MSEKHLSDIKFDSFDFEEPVKQGIEACGFINCTPIQAETLPIALQGKDVAGQAQTGTGKTAAFALATIQKLLKSEKNNKHPRALIVAPTRELVVQIEKDTKALAQFTDLKIGAVFGGTGYDSQKKMLEDGLDILIGTPGRLIDYFKQHIYNLKSVDVVVMDEADRMFDLGFIKDIRYLLRRCPPPEQRQGLLFSATLSYRVTELAYEHMNNPVTVKIEAEMTADRINQTGYMVANEEKIPLLIGLLQKMDAHRTIVFVNTKRAADEVWGYLEGNGIKTAILSGDVPQKKRLSLLKSFQTGTVDVLVATDVAARGLHITDVSHVINYDLPEDSEDYVHRIGRTARAGASGDAISFACETFAFSLPDIEEFISMKIDMQPVSGDLLAEVDPASRIRRERKPRPPHSRKKSAHKGGHNKGRRRPTGNQKASRN
ncbi:MAG: DEAD/DEAH box helicase [Gammaproteobacteria bacterium]|nr:DEAD/DEAH box helicase [Gammaproteobacteria bacterium]